MRGWDGRVSSRAESIETSTLRAIDVDIGVNPLPEISHLCQSLPHMTLDGHVRE